jgi:hypothetical protein
MTLDEALTAHLRVVLANLVGDRVYPAELPQRPQYPAVVYRRTGDDEEMSHDGPSTKHPTYQFECYGTTLAEASRVFDALRLALSGYKGRMPSQPDGVLVDACFFIDSDTNFYDEDDGVRVHWVATQYEIWFNEE